MFGIGYIYAPNVVGEPMSRSSMTMPVALTGRGYLGWRQASNSNVASFQAAATPKSKQGGSDFFYGYTADRQPPQTRSVTRSRPTLVP